MRQYSETLCLQDSIIKKNKNMSRRTAKPKDENFVNLAIFRNEEDLGELNSREYCPLDIKNGNLEHIRRDCTVRKNKR